MPVTNLTVPHGPRSVVDPGGSLQTLKDRAAVGNCLAAAMPRLVDGLRVLIVDSNAESAERLSKHVGLWTEGHRLATNGFEALRLAATQHPQVAILQLDLPWMSGIQLARHLRWDFPDSNMLIVGVVEKEDYHLRESSVASGIDATLVAPIDLATLDTLLLLESCLKGTSTITEPRDYEKQ